MLASERAASIERTEQARDLERLEVVLRLATAALAVCGLALLPMWLGVGAGDALAATLAFAVALGSMLLALVSLRGDASPRRARLGWALGLVVPVVALGMVTLAEGRIVSAFAHGAVMLTVAQALARPGPVRRMAVETLVIAAGWPLTVAVGLSQSPTLAAQLDDPRLRADFTESCLALCVAAILALAGQHAGYRARRALLTAREARRYTVGPLLGRGGMGEVYAAFHPGLGTEVALKVLRAAGDGASTERFVREIRATAELEHPGIVRVLDCGTTDEGHLYYTMERLRGRTLSAVVKRAVANTGKGLPPGRAVHLVLQAAQALDEAHRRGLVHRDIKPENLFVSGAGGERDVVRVLDFGIARVLAADTKLTGDGTLIGTPGYMPLEQALGEEVDARADVYALGAVLYFALAGVPAFDPPTLFAVLAAHAAGTLVPLGARCPELPAPLLAVVERAMRTNREDRFEGAGAMADALEATGLATTVPETSAEAPSTEPDAERSLADDRTQDESTFEAWHASGTVTRDGPRPEGDHETASPEADTIEKAAAKAEKETADAG